MPQSFSLDISTQPIWSHQLATAVDTVSCALMPALLLMERAGAAIHAQALQHGAAQHKIIILVGSGNNGGDALVAARLLHAYQPEVVLLNAKPSSALAAQQLHIYTAVTQTQAADLLYRQGMLTKFAAQKVFVIDGIAGLGWRGEARGTVQEIITAVNAMPDAKVLAIDIPSGLATDGATASHDSLPLSASHDSLPLSASPDSLPLSASPDSLPLSASHDSLPLSSSSTAIKADVTLTFGARKAAHVLTASRALCGTVHVADIGFPSHCVQEAMNQHPPQLHWVDSEPLMTANPFAALPRTAHKYQRGHVLIIGGSQGKYGAPLLSGLAALRAGAGLVSVALDQRDEQQPQGLPLELVYEYFFRDGTVDSAELAKFVAARRVQVIVIGPGTVDTVIDDQLWQFLQKYTAEGGFVVIDAAAVSGVLERKAKQGILLTPHPGEWERMMTAKTPHPHTLELCTEVKRIAVAQGLYLVYKSACPLLFTPHAADPAYVCDSGDNSLAKAGSGDVLCGLIAAHLLALRAVTPAFFTAYAQLAERAKLLSARQGPDTLLASDLL